MLPSNRLLALLVATLPLSLLPVFLPWLTPLTLVAWAAFVAALAVDFVVLVRTRPEVKVKHPEFAAVGAAFGCDVELDHGSGVALPIDVLLAVARPLIGPPTAHQRLAPGARAMRIEVAAPHRGLGGVLAVHTRLFGPLGLIARIDRSERGCGPVHVVPDADAIDKKARQLVGSQPLLQGAKRETWTGEGREFESLQGYSAGMDVRAIDWKASARHQALRVRRFHVERRQRIVICLDVGRAMRDPLDGLERLDHAVQAGLVLAKAALYAGDLVGLHAYGSTPKAWVPVRGGLAQGGHLRRACADLLAENRDTNHVLGLHDLLGRVRRRSMIAVFTEFSDATTAELMIEVLGQLARRHVVVFVALGDPLLDAPLAATPSDSVDLARAIVASSLSERREAVLVRLARLGIHVVHAKAGVAANAVVERYVRIKSRGLIG